MILFRKYFFCTATCLFATFNPLHGQSKMDSLQYIPEITVVAPFQKEVIPAQKLAGEELKSLGSLSVADAIRYFSGVQIKDYGGIGGLKTVDIRSMGTNHMGVFYDGIQLGNAQNGQIDLGKFSLDNIEEISLYNGQKSQIFQPAKDFGTAGSIYLTSRKPRFVSGNNTNLKSVIKTGSFGLLNPSILFEHRLSDSISITFNGEWINADGEYEFRYKRKNLEGDVAYDTTAVRKNGDINATRMEFGVHGSIPDGAWNFRAYNYNSERGMPGAIVNNVWRRGERLWDNNSFLQGTLKKDVSSGFRAMANAKYANDFTHYINKDENLLQIDNNYRQKEIYLSATGLYSLLQGWDVSLSCDYQWNKLNKHNLLNEAETEDFPVPLRNMHLVAFATAMEKGKLKGQASILGNFVQNKSGNENNSAKNSAFSPAFFLSYKPLQHQNLNINAFFKQSFRMPTFNDLYYTDMGNANLRPEYVKQYNIGVWYEKNRKNRFISHFRFNADGYYNEVKDKIIAYPKGQQFRWTMLNLGYVEIRGVDVSMQTALEPAKDFSVTGRIQYTFQHAQDFTNKTDNYYSHQIPYIPHHSGSFTANSSYRSWGINYSFIYVGERYNQQENIRFNYMQPWYTNDLSIMKHLKIIGYSTKISAEINNLLSQDYDVILNYPMPKRNFRLSLSVEI